MRKWGVGVKRTGRILSVATELGLSMGIMTALLVVGGLALGRWIDGQLGSSPIAAIIGLLIGAVLGQLVMLRMARTASEEMRQNQSALRPSREPLALAIKTLGLMIIPALAGFAIGYGANRLLGTDAVFTVVLVLVGVFVGLILTVRYARR